MHNPKQNAWVQGTLAGLRHQPKRAEIETLCESLGLDMNDVEQLANSPEIQQFCREKKDTRYVPTELLRRLDLSVSDELEAAA